jgi:hypothetical protein
MANVLGVNYCINEGKFRQVRKWRLPVAFHLTAGPSTSRKCIWDELKAGEVKEVSHFNLAINYSKDSVNFNF